jgi:hypothetical protein
MACYRDSLHIWYISNVEKKNKRTVIAGKFHFGDVTAFPFQFYEVIFFFFFLTDFAALKSCSRFRSLSDLLIFSV